MGMGMWCNYESAPWPSFIEWCLNTNGWKGNRDRCWKKALILSDCSPKCLLTDWLWIVTRICSVTVEKFESFYGACECCTYLQIWLIWVWLYFTEKRFQSILINLINVWVKALEQNPICRQFKGGNSSNS